MDAGLYNLSADQTSINSNGQLITFNNTKRACTGVSLSAGVFTFAAGNYLVLKNFDWARTSGSGGYAYAQMHQDPSGTPSLYGGDVPVFSVCEDDTATYCGTAGPGITQIQTSASLTLGPCAVRTVTFTANSAYCWMVPILLDGPLVSMGLYGLSANQTGINAAAQQVTWNSTIRACSGVSLSGGVFTFTSDGIYVAIASPLFSRSSGTGKTIATRWVTDSASTGNTPYSVQMSMQAVTCDSTTDTGSNAGCVAVVNRSGSDVSIGSNILSVAATTAFSANTGYSSVEIWRLT